MRIFVRGKQQLKQLSDPIYMIYKDFCQKS